MGISLYRNRDFSLLGGEHKKSGDPMKETGIEARDHTLPDLLVRSAYDTDFRTNSWSFLPFVLIMPFLPPCEENPLSIDTPEMRLFKLHKSCFQTCRS